MEIPKERRAALLGIAVDFFVCRDLIEDLILANKIEKVFEQEVEAFCAKFGITNKDSIISDTMSAAGQMAPGSFCKEVGKMERLHETLRNTYASCAR